MKKKLVILTIVILFIGGLGGYYFYMKQKEQDKEEVFWDKQKPRIEMFFRYNFKDIKTIHYTETTKSPMGVTIYGYFNENPDLYFSASVAGYEEEFNDNITYANVLTDQMKPEEEVKTVNEIIKEKKNTH